MRGLKYFILKYFKERYLVLLVSEHEECKAPLTVTLCFYTEITGFFYSGRVLMINLENYTNDIFYTPEQTELITVSLGIFFFNCT